MLADWEWFIVVKWQRKEWRCQIGKITFCFVFCDKLNWKLFVCFLFFGSWQLYCRKQAIEQNNRIFDKQLKIAKPTTRTNKQQKNNEQTNKTKHERVQLMKKQKSKISKYIILLFVHFSRRNRLPSNDDRLSPLLLLLLLLLLLPLELLLRRLCC